MPSAHDFEDLADSDGMTVREASRKWGISERLVQRLCSEGRIEGARKFGRAWAIPSSARKPVDPRKAAAEEAPAREAAAPADPERSKGGEAARDGAAQDAAGGIFGDVRAAADGSDRASVPMPLINTPFAPGTCASRIEEMRDDRQRDIARAEFCYFRGRPEEAVAIAKGYLQHPDLSLKLSACLISSYASLSLGAIGDARRCLAQIQEVASSLDEDAPARQRAMVGAIAAAAAVLLHLPAPQSDRPLGEALRFLPPGLRLLGLYVWAHAAYLQQEYARSFGIVEAALALQKEVYPIPMMYLHLVAVMDLMSLRRSDDARRHLLAAWDLARPDDLIEPFGEHHGLLGGMLEAVIKKDWPEDFKRIIAITYRFSAGWRKIHNPDTGQDVADNLTTTEFAASMLAARGWTNKEIADHMDISINTVKQYISSSLLKLGITRRQDLARHMLK